MFYFFLKQCIVGFEGLGETDSIDISRNRLRYPQCIGFPENIAPRTALWGGLLKGGEELSSLSWDRPSSLCGTRESSPAKQLGLKPEQGSIWRPAIRRKTIPSASSSCFQETGETHQLTIVAVESQIPEIVCCGAETDWRVFREGLRRTGPARVRGHLPKFQYYPSQ